MNIECNLTELTSHELVSCEGGALGLITAPITAWIKGYLIGNAIN